MVKIQCFLLIAVIVEIRSTNLRRSLISRFTSNPLFLSAFGEHRDSPEYPPPTHHESDKRVTFFEKFKIVEPHRGFFENSETSAKIEKLPDFHSSIEDHNDENSEEFEHFSHDEDEDEASFVHSEESQEFHANHEDNSEEISENLHITQYNITDIDTTGKLPHFEQNHQYLPPQKFTDTHTDSSGGKIEDEDTPQFNQLPHFEQKHQYLPPQKFTDTQLSSSGGEVEDEDTPQFNQLPHYDKIKEFLPPLTQKVSKTGLNSNTDATVEQVSPQKFNQLPHYDKIKEFLPPSAQTFAETRLNSSITDVVINKFNKFPHSGNLPPQKFADSSGIEIVDDDLPQFNQLPHYDKIKEFLPPSAQKFSDTRPNLGGIEDDAPKFNQLPHFDKIREYLPLKQAQKSPDTVILENFSVSHYNISDIENSGTKIPGKITKLPQFVKTETTQEISEVGENSNLNPSKSQTESFFEVNRNAKQSKNRTKPPKLEKIEQSESSESNSEPVEFFKSVPLYEVHEIFRPNSTKPTDRQRKFKPRRRNKTGLPTKDRLEFKNLPQFGRNQSFVGHQPNFRNIAEIPLEDNFDKDKLRVNSYGEKIN